jgi:hypothetical protein
VQAAHPHVSASAWVSLPSPASVPGLTGWELGGQAHSAADLQMRVPAGQLELTALLSRDRREIVRVTVDPLGTRVAPGDLAFARPREPAESLLPGGEAPGSVVGDASAVIRAGTPALQRCYERSLKNESNGSLSLRLAVVLDARGRVREVESSVAEGSTAKLPRALAQCIRTTVSGFRFAPPGDDGARIEAPLRFQLRR